MGIGSFLKKALPVIGVAAAVVTGGASLAATGIFGASAAAAGAGLTGGSALGALGTVGKIGGAISALGSVASSLSQPASTYAGAMSTAYQAKQASTDYLTAADNFIFQSGVSQKNADIAARNLDYEIQRNFAISERMIRENRKAVRTARAVYGSAGVSGEGSVNDVISDMATEGALNVALEDFESRQRQRGYTYQKEAALSEKSQYEKAAAQSRANAKSVLEEGLNASKGQKLTSYAQGLNALPGAIKSVTDLVGVFSSGGSA